MASSAPAPTPIPPEIVTIALEPDGGTAEVTVTPARVGANVIEVVLRDDEGRVINPVEPPTVELTQPELDVGPLRTDVTAVYIGEYEATVDLSYAGEWDVEVRVRVSDFDSVAGSGPRSPSTSDRRRASGWGSSRSSIWAGRVPVCGTVAAQIRGHRRVKATVSRPGGRATHYLQWRGTERPVWPAGVPAPRSATRARR